MNLKYSGWLLAVLGQVLIVLGFFYFFDVTSLTGGNVCWLDFIVVSIVYWLCLTTFFSHPIALDDPSGKQAAGLGIRWGALTLYGVAAIAVVVLGMIVAINDKEVFRFKWQLLLQVLFLFLLLVSLYTSCSVNAFAGKVHAKEGRIKDGKTDIRIELQELMEIAQSSASVPEQVQSRISAIYDDTRFITPSASSEAKRADDKILADISTLSYAITDYELNKERISETLVALERHFRQRKSAC